MANAKPATLPSPRPSLYPLGIGLADMLGYRVPDKPRLLAALFSSSANHERSNRVAPAPTRELNMRLERVFAIRFSSLYPMYVKKAEAKGRSKDELDRVICWLTGYSEEELLQQIGSDNDLETFYANAPHFNPNASLIKGVVCGIRVEDVEHPLMQKIRYLDKLVDELAKGKALEKILRT